MKATTIVEVEVLVRLLIPGMGWSQPTQLSIVTLKTGLLQIDTKEMDQTDGNPSRNAPRNLDTEVMLAQLSHDKSGQRLRYRRSCM